MLTKEIIFRAHHLHTVVPAFNIPHLPMMQPIVQAVRDENSFALIQVARLEWEKFCAQSLEAVAQEFEKVNDSNHVNLHLDHVPVIDEDQLNVDYLEVVGRALKAGYQSVMVDGSRLSLEENIAATKAVATLAHFSNVPVEAELGAVLGHESGPMPPYEEIFKSGKGFTDVDEAVRFVKESNCDWLSVAVGNVHGAISQALLDQKKPDARLDIEHIALLSEKTGIPLVLHGGSGIQKEYIMQAIQNGIAKINVGTEVRQAYERAMKETQSVQAAQEATYNRTRELVRDFFEISGNRYKLEI